MEDRYQLSLTEAELALLLVLLEFHWGTDDPPGLVDLGVLESLTKKAKEPIDLEA